MADIKLLLRDYGRDVDDRCEPVTVADLERHLALSAADDTTAGEGRSDEVAEIQVLDERPSGNRALAAKGRWPLILLGAAAAAAVVIVLVLASAGEDPPDELEIFTDDREQPEPVDDDSGLLEPSERDHGPVEKVPLTQSSSLRELTDWLSGSDVVEVGGTNHDFAALNGATVKSVNVGIDWQSLVLQAGGDDIRQRVANGEKISLGCCLDQPGWDPQTGILDVSIWADQTALDAAYRRLPDAPERQSSGVRFRVSASGTRDDWVIEIEDMAQGELIGFVAGSLPVLAPEAPAQLLQGRALDDTLALLVTGVGLDVFFLSAGDSLELVDPPPWEGLPGDMPTFVRTDNEIYAYHPSGAWRSADARTWQSRDTTDLPTIHVGDPPTDFFEGPGGVLLAVAELDVEPPESAPPLLRSDDGVSWAPPSEPPIFTIDDVQSSRLLITDDGFILRVRSDGETVEWTSTDGDVWTRAD